MDPSKFVLVFTVLVSLVHSKSVSLHVHQVRVCVCVCACVCVLQMHHSSPCYSVVTAADVKINWCPGEPLVPWFTPIFNRYPLNTYCV